MQDETQQTELVPGDGAATGGGGISREDLSVGLIAVGSVMMLIVITRMLRRSQSRRAASGSAGSTREMVRATTAATPGGAERLERLMADAEELTRRLAAVLENKAERIEVLIEHADERLAALREAEERAAREPKAAARGEGPGLALTEHAETERGETAPATDPLHMRVYELADGGMAPVDIAREIDRPTGQVELILALRRA